MEMTQEYFADLLVRLFPEKSDSLTMHYQKYHELLGHVFFAEEINIPLEELLQKASATYNKNRRKKADNVSKIYKEENEIEKYCNFIEKMWFEGNEAVRNIVTVTIVEGMSEVWNSFGTYLSKQFIWDINDKILPYIAVDVPRLATTQGRFGKWMKKFFC